MHKIIKNILMNHKGKENAIKSKEISLEMNLPMEDTQSVTRKIIWETAEIFELPLVACSNGYFIAQNDAELDEYNLNLEKRIGGIRKLQAMVNSNYNKQKKQTKKASVATGKKVIKFKDTKKVKKTEKIKETGKVKSIETAKNVKKTRKERARKHA